jgi:membrane-associated PAP2 superfamily phosphatase
MEIEKGVTIGNVRLDPIVLSVLAIVIVSGVFLVAPQLDVWFSRLFYDPETGFPASRIPLLQALRQLNNLVIAIVVGAIIASIVLKLALPNQPSLIKPQWSTYILTTLLVGTVLVVNGIFKSFSGRPRPYRVEEFGGADAFVPAWHLYGSCPRNCSFISGEGSSAFWVFAIWLLAPPDIRRATLVPAIVYVGAISINRIVFGGHFLSDVLLSWVVMALIIAVAYRFLILSPPDWLSNERQEARWTKAGLGIRRAIGSVFGRG